MQQVVQATQEKQTIQATYSINYKEDLKRIDKEIVFCEGVISGKVKIDGNVELDAYKERLKHLKRSRGSIVDNPAFREGALDSYLTR